MKSIIVPISKKAEIDLDYDKADESLLIKWDLLDSEYEELDRIGVFSEINNLCDTLIDEYEDEHIVAEKLLIVSKVYSKSQNKLIQKLMKLIHEAIENNTSIHFYF